VFSSALGWFGSGGVGIGGGKLALFCFVADDFGSVVSWGFFFELPALGLGLQGQG
jgi:hypothetical protein